MSPVYRTTPLFTRPLPLPPADNPDVLIPTTEKDSTDQTDPQPRLDLTPKPVFNPPISPDLSRIINDEKLASAKDTPVQIPSSLPVRSVIPAMATVPSSLDQQSLVGALIGKLKGRFVREVDFSKESFQVGKKYRIILAKFTKPEDLKKLKGMVGHAYTVLGFRVSIFDAGEIGERNFISLHIAREEKR